MTSISCTASARATPRCAATRRNFSTCSLRAAPAAKDVLDAIEVLRGMNSDNARKVPADAPTNFIKPRWQKLVMTDAGIDRRYYELCALSELKNSLRSGDIWVQGSRQFKDFEDYLVPPAKFASLKQTSELPLAVTTDCDQYLHERLTLLETQLATANRMAQANELPDAIITESGLKITPLDAAVPDTAQALIDQTAMILPHVKITELLLEVDEWTGFTRHFAHLKSGDLAKDKNLLLTTILADAINLGLTKMAESCPGTTYAKLAWLQAWHIRDETYGTALAELVNAQFRHPFAEHWGDGTTSSSDGQNFRTGSKAESTATSTRNTAAARADVLHPHLRPVRAVPHQGRERRRARLDLRARRPAVPRIRSAHRGALHRYGRLHRSRLWSDAPAGLPLRAAHPRLGRHQALHPEGRRHL
jgi:hypothetical protein